MVTAVMLVKMGAILIMKMVVSRHFQNLEASLQHSKYSLKY